jgi:endoglucanase
MEDRPTLMPLPLVSPSLQGSGPPLAFFKALYPLRGVFVCLALIIILTSCTPAPSGPDPLDLALEPPLAPKAELGANSKAFEIAKRLSPGINFGNMLEAPEEGAWGLRLEERWFDLAKQAGFVTIRLPIRWSNHAERTRPYRLHANFLARIDTAVAMANARGLTLILTMQHYRQLEGRPLDYQERPVDQDVVDERFVALWKQIAEHYRFAPENILFELYNEPHGRLNARRWNSLYPRALAAIRATNPQRLVVLGPADYYHADALTQLHPPANDGSLLITIHHYEPIDFTFQGAPWVTGAHRWVGRGCCDDAQKARILAPLKQAKAWAHAYQYPIFVGEFGSYRRAPLEDRVRYTAFVRSAIENEGFAWAYWELAHDFGLYDRQQKRWRLPLYKALFTPPPAP